MKKYLLASLFAALALFGERAARADITFCNNSPNEIWVMYSQQNVNESLSCGINYDTVGWYAVSPNGGCTTAESGCLCNAWSNLFGDCPFTDFLYYADDANGHYWGGGDDNLSFWTSNDAFHVCSYGSGAPYNCGGSCPPFSQYVTPDVYWYGDPSCGVTINFQ